MFYRFFVVVFLFLSNILSLPTGYFLSSANCFSKSFFPEIFLQEHHEIWSQAVCKDDQQTTLEGKHKVATTVVPTKSDSDEILCLQLLSKK